MSWETLKGTPTMPVTRDGRVLALDRRHDHMLGLWGIVGEREVMTADGPDREPVYGCRGCGWREDGDGRCGCLDPVVAMYDKLGAEEPIPF